ncbi:hypothetical protein HHI36_010596 [Cryptolaemus montrouzieri]|uniref:Uncharacterized protein n=1 Tax=Cryptolaemus montrouzieri TaxID=559131 RepID=A0ABD2MJ66_9CUCU
MWVKFSILFGLFLCVRCLGKQSMIVKRSGYEDQAVAASGYSYQADGNGPISYSTFKIGSGNLPLRDLIPAQSVGIQPLSYLPAGVPLKAPPNLYGAFSNFGNGHLTNPQLLQFGEWMPAEYRWPYINHPNNGLYKNGIIGEHHQYAKGNGNKYDEANNQEEGRKGEQLYKNQQNYDNAAKGKHLNQDHKEHYAQEGGNAANNQESANHYSQNKEAAKGVKGGSFSESSGHKKGSKTTGYHKVYHKDEYKKDHSFYDESNTSGHHNKYESGNSQFGKESGASEADGHSNSAHEKSDYGAKGYRDEGKYLKEDKGHQNVNGDSAFRENNENYAKKGGQQYQDENGYAVSESD